jgi:hypothetical protein
MDSGNGIQLLSVGADMTATAMIGGSPAGGFPGAVAG